MEHLRETTQLEMKPNVEAQTKHPLPTYAGDEKRCLVTTRDEEQSKCTGFMLRLKR